MDIHVLWAIIAVVIAVVAIGILAVVAWQRKNAAKDDTAQTVLAEKAETAEQIESEQSEPEIEQPKSETAEPTNHQLQPASTLLKTVARACSVCVLAWLSQLIRLVKRCSIF